MIQILVFRGYTPITQSYELARWSSCLQLPTLDNTG